MTNIDFHPAAEPGGEPAFFSAQIARASRFYLDLNPPARAALVVICGGRETCAPDYHVSRSTFAYPCLEVVIDGHGTLVIGEREHPLEAGSVFVYGPGVGHVIRTDQKHPMTKCFISLAGRRAAPLLKDCGLSPGTVVHTLAVDAVLALVDELTATAARHTPRGPAICALILEQLLLRLGESAVPAGTAQSRSFLTYQRCRRHIADHHRTLGDLEAVAAACGVDVSYLCRLFQRYHKQSPYRYLTQLKMAAAAEALQQPGRLVKEVADELGYSDPFLFSRAFKQVYGVAPRHFQLRRGR